MACSLASKLVVGKPERDGARQVISIRLSPDEKRKLEANAKASGYSSSSKYLRDLIDKDERK